ncbi:uncharacterized protein LOC131937722 [Physella acuta]|uniref:uncharacterized protein LOC131937722 n=1 Tax=Physella acuta TaxID=109671 RepID=UPI0027DC21D9|nr:uncharacterized protein LOC131937722 [Physella acuta]
MNTIVIFALACVIASTSALVGETCTRDDQCDAGECCQILSLFMIASRRQLEAINMLQSPTSGTCQKYQLEGDSCSTFEKMNGYCSCEPGTECHMTEVPLPTDTPTSKMIIMLPPRPGYQWVSKCEKPAA